MRSSYTYEQILGLLVILFLAGTDLLQAQEEQTGVITDKSYTTESLIRDIFVKGSCDNVSNIESLGDPNGIGYFENGMDAIGIDKGIIISTGDIKGAEGPNSDTRLSGNFQDFSVDRDLKLLATGEVRDAVGIEFDFVPLDSIVSFRYVFASEEYCEFVGKNYNDVFGFFISGPGIDGRFADGAKNVALIPGTNDIVAINSVNHLKNSDFFVGNFRQDDVESCNIEFQPSNKQNLIEYDGFTTVLSASLKLIPCQVYHIRFVISDVQDNWFDSAVFLEAGSFNLGGEVQITTLMPNDTTTTLDEGCDQGVFVFERANPETIDIPLTVRFKVSDISEATEGVDFDPLPDSITIPAQSMTTELPIQFINDYKKEDPERLVLELDIPCACYTGLSELTIVDPPPLEADLRDSVICYGDNTIICPEISNGTPPFTYEWSDGSTQKSLTIDPNNSDTYSITITDACSNFTILRNKVSVRPIPQATLSGDPLVCNGEVAYLDVAFTGDAPFSVSYSKNGSFEDQVEYIDQNPFKLPLTDEGTYELIAFSDKYCEGNTFGQGSVNIKGFTADWDINPASCYNSEDGQIAIHLEGGKPPFKYNWSNGVNNKPVITKIPRGQYSVTVSDSEACSRVYDIELPAPDPLLPVSFRCEDLSVGIINIQASGGSPPYQYAIDGLNFEDKKLFHRLTPGEQYNLVVVDDEQCILEQGFTMPAPFTKLVDLPNFTDTQIGIPKEITPTFGIPAHLIQSVKWTPIDALSCGSCVIPEVMSLEDLFITAEVEDIFGCKGVDKTYLRVEKKVNVFIPDAFSPNNDGINDKLVVFANPDQVSQVSYFGIFDRWGNQVFLLENFPPNNPSFGWDGICDSKPLPAGIYPYKMQSILIDGTTLTINGQISLVK